MVISATLTFAMLALAREVGDPYWVWLLHAQEISLCFFMFFASGIFLRTLEKSGGIIKGPRGRIIVQKPEGRWKIMLAVLFSFTAAAYRYSAFKAFAALHDAEPLSFNPWLSRGNLFSITSATLACLIAMRRLGSNSIVEKSTAYIVASVSLISFAPLASPLGISIIHPLTLLFVSACAAFLYTLSLIIGKRTDFL